MWTLLIILGLLMAKLTLNTIGSRYGSIDALNDNSDLIEAAFENTLSRDGTGPNNMESDLDMDSNRIINLQDGINNQDAVTKSQLNTVKTEISLLVQSLSTATYGDADNISYVPAGVGGEVLSVEAKLREFSSPVEYGAAGNLGVHLPLMTGEVGAKIITTGFYSEGDNGGATYVIRATSTEPASFKVTLSDGKVAVLIDRVVSPLQVGYKLDVSQLNTIAAVDANWTILKNLLSDLKTSKTRELIKFDTQTTLESVGAEWYSGRSFPIGFYSDSTTDGATTTGHVSSTGSNSPFKVTINESPNAYPAKVEEYIKKIRKSGTPVRCYNGGFDSMSFANGFGLKHWYNTWFRGLNGSNVNWSDVKMIVVGFGTSDSINLNNPGPTMDTYALDLECVVIDAFLRGVQPVLQGPVLTTQHVGETVEYRNSKESLILIETVQKRLCQKYTLEWLSMRESMEKPINNFDGILYKDLMSVSDMVHPGDVGHRTHAMYLVDKIYAAIARLKQEDSVTHIFAGHPAYIPAFTEIVSPTFRGGLVLKQVGGVVSDDTYFYSWKNVDGNQKDPSEFLLRIPVYVEKPTMLYMNMGQANVGANRTLTIEHCYADITPTITVTQDTFNRADPAQQVWDRKTQVCLLTYGLNIINVYAGASTDDWQFVSFYLAALSDLPTLTLGRGTAGSEYWNNYIQFPDNHDGYVRKVTRRKQKLCEYYNSFDNITQTFALQLTRAFAVGTTYQFFTHFNDYATRQDSYNLIEILGDVLTLKVSYGGTVSTINSQTITGLNAALAAGTDVEIRFKSQYFSSNGILVQFITNGTTRYSYTAPLGDLYFDGYGFEAPAVLYKNATHSSRRAVSGLGPGVYGYLL